MTQRSEYTNDHTAPQHIPAKDFRGMVESTPAIPWMVDLATFQFTYVGPQAEIVLGYPVEQWYETDFWGDHMHPDDRDFALAFCAEASQKGKNYHFEYRMLHRDGHSVTLSDYVNIVIENGVAVRLQGFMFDVTDQKYIENAIASISAGVSFKTGQAFYNQLVNSLASLFDVDCAFIALHDENDPDLLHTIAIWKNGKLAENFSYSLKNTPCETAIKRNTCCHPLGVRDAYPDDKLLIDFNVESYIGTRLIGTKGNTIGVITLLDSEPMKNTGRYLEILEIFAVRAATEIERVKAEDALKQHQNDLERIIEQRTAELLMLNRELESFSYSVSHDLRSPLRSISGFSHILAEDYADALDDEAKNYLARIQAGTSYMEQLIDALLQLSRVTKAELKRTRINISSMAEEILENLQNLDENRLTKLAIQKDMMATADYGLIYSVLENLIGNAWKYSSKKDITHIEIGISEQSFEKREFDSPADPVFYVTDNGAGFDMAYKDKLFGAFQRLHSKNEFEGTGIGLTTVQRIIHRHGGEIWAESVIDESTTFYFTLGN